MGRICFEDFQDYASSREVIVLSKNNTSSFSKRSFRKFFERGIRAGKENEKDDMDLRRP